MIDWKILTSRKFFPSWGLQALFSRRMKQEPKRRLLLQATPFRTYKGTTLSPLGLYKQVHLKVHWLQCKIFLQLQHTIYFHKKIVENHEYLIKDFKVHVSRQANHSQFTNLISCFHLSRKLKKLNPVSSKNPFHPFFYVDVQFAFRLRASLCKILISSFPHKMDFAHNFSVEKIRTIAPVKRVRPKASNLLAVSIEPLSLK